MGTLRMSPSFVCSCVLLLLLASTQAISDDTHDLEGVIFNTEGEPISGVRVTVSVDGKVVSKNLRTDAEGRYQIDLDADAGVAEVTFDRSGYHITGVTELAVGSKLRISKVESHNGPPKTTLGRADTLAAMEFVALAILTTDDEPTKAAYREVGVNLRHQLKTFCGLEKDPKLGWWIKHRVAEVNKLLWQAGIPEEPPASAVK